jgi:hypothetical protein
MGHQAIIYGRIQEIWEGTSTRWPKVPEYNQCVLEALPDEDEHWPFLTRHLFAVAPRAYHGNAQRGEYRGRIVHFAVSLNGDPHDREWPAKFLSKLEQNVLTRLLWKSAKVHFESALFAEKVFVYQSDPESIGALQIELAEKRFGERVDSEVTWNRQELAGLELRSSWLH